MRVLLAFFLVVLGMGPAVAASEQRLREIAADRQWLALLHYYHPLGSPERRGQIDDPGFYLSAAGRDDPLAELQATLLVFRQPIDPAATDDHPRCRLPARFAWLDRQLGLVASGFPDPPCPKYEEWFRRIDPGSLTLVFPASYLNNPASMFGHTLLRIDPPRQPGQDPTPLTSYAVNYGAYTGDDGGVAFALKGLAGFYRGHFSLMPYDRMVRTYNDVESRDIWEYELGIARPDVARLVSHLWELEGRWTDYYFLKNNCSYMLLSLLEVARPDLHLTDDFHVYALPTDTVRTVLTQEGMLGTARFRPSARTRIDHLRQGLPASRQRLAQALADGTIKPDDPSLAGLPAAERARVIELAQGLLRYRIDAGDTGNVAGTGLPLLRARAALRDVPAPSEPPTPAIRPDEGHLSARAAVGGGVVAGEAFGSLELLPAFHGQLDPPAGYVPGASIQLLGGEIRGYAGHGLRLERLDLARIRSTTPVDPLFTPFSWRADVGAERWHETGRHLGDIVGSIGGAGGLAFAPADKLTIAGLIEASALADSDWPHGRLAAVGPRLDLSWEPTSALTIRAQAFGQSVLGEGTDERWGLGIDVGIALGRNLGLTFGLGRQDDGDGAYGRMNGAIVVFF